MSWALQYHYSNYIVAIIIKFNIATLNSTTHNYGSLLYNFLKKYLVSFSLLFRVARTYTTVASKQHFPLKKSRTLNIILSIQKKMDIESVCSSCHSTIIAEGRRNYISRIILKNEILYLTTSRWAIIFIKIQWNFFTVLFFPKTYCTYTRSFNLSLVYYFNARFMLPYHQSWDFN